MNHLSTFSTIPLLIQLGATLKLFMKTKARKLLSPSFRTCGIPLPKKTWQTSKNLYWERLNLVDDDNFKIPEVQFKIAIISSLPPSWDNFTQPYISIQKGDTTDPKVHTTSQELIGVLKKEYAWHLWQAGKSIKQETVHQLATYNKQKPSLTSRLADTNCGDQHLVDADRCSQCNMWSHKTTNCRFLGQSKCGFCNRFSHKTEDCYSKKAKDLKQKYEPIADKTGNKRKGQNGGHPWWWTHCVCHSWIQTIKNDVWHLWRRTSV